MRVGASRGDVVDAATRSLRRERAVQLDVVHSVVQSGAWARDGYRSPTAWLIGSTRESAGACRVTLVLAERIQHMPLVKASFVSGDLSESALRLLAEAWSPSVADAFAADEELLLGWGLRLSHRDLRVVFDTWRWHADPDREERAAADRFDSRTLHLSSLLDGMGQLDGLLDPEGFELVREALRDLSARCDGDERRPEQRRADALVSLARFYLTNGTQRTGHQRRRPKVVAVIGYDDLVVNHGAGTVDTGSGGITVGSDTIRRLACDAGIHRFVAAADGTILNYGRQTRTISDALFDVLATRDHRCRILDCTVPAGACDAHHARHWADDGETEPDNLALLCWHHHHFVHEQHWSIEPLGGGHFQLIDPHGGIHHMRPPMIGAAQPQLAPVA